MLLATSRTGFPNRSREQVMGLARSECFIARMAVDGPDAYVAGIMDRNFPRVCAG